MINIFIGAIIFSVWSVVLFFGKSIGLSMLLFALPITLFIMYILEKNKKVENKRAKWLLVPITLLSSTYLIFNNTFFNIINALIMPILLIIMILGLYNEKFKFNLDLIIKPFKILFYPMGCAKETFEKMTVEIREKFKTNKKSEKNKNIMKILKAILITVPIAIIIILLLSAADETFASIFKDIFKGILDAILNIEIAELFAKGILIFCLFVYLSCFFYYMIFAKRETEKANKENKKEIKDNFTIKMILSVLNIIYLIFCFIQIKSLVMIEDKFTLSHYARQGFFQLIAVSLINLVTVLIAKRKEKEKFIKIMSILMVIFTLIILASAGVRMYVYESAFGYTFLRLLVYFSLFTEVILLVPTTLYIIDKKINLTNAYFIIILTVYVFMNFTNFDYIIAKRNIDRYEELEKFDLDYLINNTGTDAVSEIARIATKEGEMTEEKAKAGNYLKKVYNKLSLEETDFREFNISKMNAKKVIEEKNIQNTIYKYEKKKSKTEIKNEVRKEENINDYLKAPTNDRDILYTQKISENTSIRVINAGNALGKRNLIRIQKTTNDGETWIDTINSPDKVITINNGAKYAFINDKVGLINNLSLMTRESDNDGLLVTVDGGQNFKNANFVFPLDIKDTAFYVVDVPYLEDGRLKVKLFAPTNIGSVDGTYYEFVSVDNGINWMYSELPKGT